MALNYPGPFGLRMFYTTTISSVAVEHMAEYNIDLTDATPTPGTAFADLDVQLQDLTSDVLSTYCNAWTTLIKPLFNNGAGNSIDRYELWQYDDESFDATFISALSAGTATTGTTAATTAGQVIITYRTIGGGIMKLNFMETIIAVGIRDTPPFANATLDAINTFILSGDNAFLGRDNTFPFASIAMYPGTNEALFKKRFRNY